MAGAGGDRRRCAAGPRQAECRARPKGVEAVDLSQGFRDKTEDVFIDVGHLNAAGHRILASQIAEAVLHPVAAAAP